MNDKVQMVIEGNLGIITLNNPPRNLLDRDVILGINEIWRTLEGNDDLRAIVLTGAGAAFSFGADIREISEVGDTALAQEMCIKGHTVFNRFWRSRIPTIAAINGKCLGGGLELALACHFRIAEDGARMGFPEIRLGLIPGWGGTQRMARIAGASVALEYVLTGRMMTSVRAQELGLVNEVCPPGDALESARKLAKRFAQKSRWAVSEALQAITRGIELTLEDALVNEAGCFGRLRETAEAEEGLRAFFEGRRPKFTG